MSKNQEYVEKYAEFAMEQMRRYGIPASVTLAQGICESANGQSELSRKGNNHFGIKATNSWVKDGGKYLLYTDDKPNEKFCQYDSVGDSYEHHSKFLYENKRYDALFKLSPDDYKGWSKGLQDAGYASSKSYASTLQNIIEKNNLQKYDQMVIKEMKKNGQEFDIDSNPRKETNEDTEVRESHNNEKNFSFPLKRDEFMLVTSPFGSRNDPLDETKSQMHKGIDLQTKNEAVLATEDKGRVINTNENANSPGGKSVTVEYNRTDGSKYQCTYMHLKAISVQQGDEVNAGQQLGISGNTGTRSTGEHLHFGVKSISPDGKTRDIDPTAYLSEIAQKGNIQLQALYNGKDLLAKYNTNGPTNDIEISQSPEDWMKKILSSEDSGVNMSVGDPIIEIAMTMFTSLMALAVQIDNKIEEEKMQAATEAAISKTINLTPLLPSLKECSLMIHDSKPILQVNSGNIQFSRELSNAEVARIQQALSNGSLSENEKRQRISGIINGIIASEQISRNYQQGVDEQQSQSESLQRK